MLKHLTLLDCAIWIGIILFQVYLFNLSRKKFKIIPIAMLFLLIESIVEFVMMFSSELAYKNVYYSLGIIESMLLSIGAIEIGGSVALEIKSYIHHIGPIVIVVPAFITYILCTPDRHFHFEWLLLDDIVRIFQLAFLISLILLLLCIALESDDAKNKRIARGYALLLALLTFSLQMQVKFGLSRNIRTLLIVSWLVGSMILALSFRCVNNGNSNMLRRIKAYGSAG
jgi:hypothetical protein